MVFPVHFFSSDGIISFLFAVAVRWYVFAKDFRSGADKRFRAFSRSSRSFSVQNRVTFDNCNVTIYNSIDFSVFYMLQVLIAMYRKCKEIKNIEIKCLLFLKSSNREKSTYFGINMQTFTPAKTPNLYDIKSNSL